MTITVKNISKKYQNLIILKDVQITIHEHDFLIVYGESGCGKTTLLQIIAGLNYPDEGYVYYDDIEMNQENIHLLNNHFSYVFQDHRLLNELNVKDNILSGINFTNCKYDQEWFDYICKELKISDLLNRKIHQISTGQRQRVAVARALIKKPDILFLDEPTGNLDDENTICLLEFLKKMHQETNITIIMVTHEESIRTYGNRIIRIENHDIFEEENKNQITCQKKINPRIHKRLQQLSIGYFVEKYTTNHIAYYLLMSLCISICCLSFFLSINVGNNFKDVLYDMASSQEESKVIELSSTYDYGKMSEDDLKEISNLEHVKNISYDLHLSYGYERTFTDEMIIKYKNKKISDTDKLIDFFKMPNMSTLVEGKLEVKGNEIVIDESIVKDLDINNPIGQTITMRIPIATCFEKQYLTETIDNSTDDFYKYVPINKNVDIDFKIVGIMNADYEENYTVIHDSEFMENIVRSNINRNLKEDQFTSSSCTFAKIEVDSLDSLKTIIEHIEDNYEISCSSQAARLMKNIENIDKIQDIYSLVNVFIFVSLIGVIFVIVTLHFSKKQKFIAEMKFLGANFQELRSFIFIESMYIFMAVVIMTIILSQVGLPLFNQIFSQHNPIINAAQMTSGMQIDLFNLNIVQLIVSLGVGFVFVIGIQLISYLKNKKKTLLEILNWEVR